MGDDRTDKAEDGAEAAVGGANEEESWSAWGASWIASARDKASATLELVKKDLDEFQDVIGSEARNLAITTANLVTEEQAEEAKEGEAKEEEQSKDAPAEEEIGVGKLWASATSYVTPALKSLAETVNKALVIDNTGDEELEIPVTSELMERQRSGLSRIQDDPGTFEREPEGAPELFDDWLDSFRLQDQEAEIAELLANAPSLRVAYARLVPSQLSNLTFWARYFYRKHQLELDVARRAALLKRSSRKEEEEEERLSWGDGDESAKLEEEIAALEKEGARSRNSSRPSQPTPTPPTDGFSPSSRGEEEKEEEDKEEAGKESEDEEVEVVEKEAKVAEEEETAGKETASTTDSWSVCSAALDESPEKSQPSEKTSTTAAKATRKAEGDEDGWVDWDD